MSDSAQKHFMLLQIKARGAHAAGFAFTAVLAAVGNVAIVKRTMTAHMRRKSGFELLHIVVVLHIWIYARFHHL